MGQELHGTGSSRSAPDMQTEGSAQEEEIGKANSIHTYIQGIQTCTET